MQGKLRRPRRTPDAASHGKEPSMRMSPTLLALLWSALPLGASATQPSPVTAKPLPQARAHSGAPAVGSDPRPKERSTPRSLLGAAPGKTLEPGKGAGLPAQGIGSPASPTGVAPKGTT